MTTVLVVKDKGIYGDTLGSGGYYLYKSKKIFKLMTKEFGPVLFAGAGSSSSILTFKAFLEKGVGDFPSLQGCGVILLTSQNRIITFDNDAHSLSAGEEINQPFFVEGSGTPAMLACLKAGCTMENAFRITSEIDRATGPDFEFIPFSALEELAREHEETAATAKKRRWWQLTKS